STAAGGAASGDALHGLDGARRRALADRPRINVARRLGLVGLIVVLSALVFGALLSGLQALKAMQ
ncbi:hypothetical protein, partial [Phenylobacterium sp.]|uniref:hypothetical protein n=1 Tax=Phenylobacterium sp. TaxID=1871053 RepID=UPI002E346ACA